MEWVKCSDRIPPEKSNFLGTDGEIIFAAYWESDSDSYKVGGWETCYYCGGSSKVVFKAKLGNEKLVTHWMPLPNLPTKD